MFNHKTVLAIIPARGGSKSVPLKNIKFLGGKPLIAYTIDEALKSRYIDRVILSTDNEKISVIAIDYGADVIMRPKELATDESSSLSVIIHTLNHVEKVENYVADIIVFLQPTSPFRRAGHIDKGIEKIESCDAVVGMSEVKEHPYFMLKCNNSFFAPFLDIKNRPLRRQDVPKLYLINASMAIAKRDYYDTVKDDDPIAPIFGKKVKGIIMDEISSIDINTQFDFSLAELISGKAYDENEGN